IEPQSLLLVVVDQPEPGRPVDAAAWERALAALPAHGVALQRLASDGGKALASAVARLSSARGVRGQPVEHQLDLWHVLREVGRAERATERTAYGALLQEEALAKKARGMAPAHAKGRALGAYVWERYASARERAAQAV